MTVYVTVSAPIENIPEIRPFPQYSFSVNSDLSVKNVVFVSLKTNSRNITKNINNIFKNEGVKRINPIKLQAMIMEF